MPVKRHMELVHDRHMHLEFRLLWHDNRLFHGNIAVLWDSETNVKRLSHSHIDSGEWRRNASGTLMH